MLILFSPRSMKVWNSLKSRSVRTVKKQRFPQSCKTFPRNCVWRLYVAEDSFNYNYSMQNQNIKELDAWQCKSDSKLMELRKIRNRRKLRPLENS